MLQMHNKCCNPLDRKFLQIGHFVYRQSRIRSDTTEVPSDFEMAFLCHRAARPRILRSNAVLGGCSASDMAYLVRGPQNAATGL